MRIRFIKTLSTSRQVFRGGKEYDVSDQDASEYVVKDLAVEVKPKPVESNLPRQATKK